MVISELNLFSSFHWMFDRRGVIHILVYWDILWEMRKPIDKTRNHILMGMKENHFSSKAKCHIAPIPYSVYLSIFSYIYPHVIDYTVYSQFIHSTLTFIYLFISFIHLDILFMKISQMSSISLRNIFISLFK